MIPNIIKQMLKNSGKLFSTRLPRLYRVKMLGVLGAVNVMLANVTSNSDSLCFSMQLNLTPSITQVFFHISRIMKNGVILA